MAITPEHFHQPMHPIFIPRCAGVRWNPLALVSPAPQFVIPAKAGIQRGGAGCGNDTRTLPPTNAPNSHTSVCRHQPARAIRTKMMLHSLKSA